MSWLNLDSLNSIKGQITKVIQETVVQPIQEEDEVDHVVKLENATVRIQELTELCSTQDQELATLRRQILELQQLQQAKVAECGAGKTSQEPNVPIDDSWFWEPDNNTSSSSSKNEEILSKSPSGGDLTIIPLDQSSDADAQERYQKRIDDTEAKLKKVNFENAVLHEKIKQLTGENRSLNENIDELDRQNSMIVDNLLGQKNQLQEKLNELKSSAEDLPKVRKELADLTAKHEKIESAYVTSVQENVNTKAQMEAINTELRRAVCENVELVASMEVKNDELRSLLTEKDKLQHEFQDFFVKMKSERDNESATVKQLTDKIQFLEEDVQKSTSYSAEIKEKVVELSEKLQQEMQEKQTIEQEFLAYQETVRELKKNSTDSQKLEDQELQEMKRKFPVIEEELRQSNEAREMAEIALKDFQDKFRALEIEHKQINEDFVALQEDDLNLQREFNDLKEKCRSVEEEKQESTSHFQGLEEKLMQAEKTMQDIAKKYEDVKVEKRQIEQDFIALQEDDLNLQREFHGFREQQNVENDNFQKLSEDNNNLQRQIIDLQSRINSRDVEDVVAVRIPSSAVQELLKKYGNLSSDADDVLRSLEDFLKSSQDTKYKLEAVEKRLAEAFSGVNQQKEEIRKLEHEKKTIQADLMHYEIECSELMKNNEILVQELEEIKSGKLETIQENSEETVAMLEKQLEECNSINRELENDCQALNKRLDAMESEREEILQKLGHLESLESEGNQKISELKRLVSSLENEKSNLQFELTELSVGESKASQDEVEKLQKRVSELEEQLREKSQEVEKMSGGFDALSKEKNDLINLVTVKHNESVQYHAEIQRLSQLLQLEMTKVVACQKCPEMQRMLQESQAAVARVAELEKLPDQVDCLRQKADLLANSLLTEQQTVKLLVKEKQELQEDKAGLAKDCERLRQHLLAVEEDQTVQMMELQRQAEEYKSKLTLLEQEAQKSSTAYTSASIRANQHAETLQAQYMLLSQQRDEISAKLSSAEDRESKNQAALINLQCALEQFQRDKDRDVEATTYRIRKQLEEERKANESILNEVKCLQSQLTDAKTGLLAASRISDQLEMSQASLSAQREEMEKLLEKCSKLEQKIHDTETNQADKVEKTLIKNLVIGYVSAPNQGDKSQILKLISAVLDFNQTESDRIGLKSSQSSDESQGLAQAFVKFLEKESQPSQPPASGSLLNITHGATSAKKPPVAAKAPEVEPPPPVQPILLSDNILQALSPPRNSSTILKDILNDT
ncbi:thyroid receptor-interacting protein 11 [Phlebotomus argentipes]|uniref:thyroid receptor-interacting protein 11 n=1 Tax=Phlebotomus argentipes TaxID=94469 RepID=UPI002892E138|nr:thyroid receptor-interacting protein 11 [Phlebotomus argentipes]